MIKTMTHDAKRGSIFAFAIGAAARCGRRSTRLLFDTLHGAYDAHLERVQMRLAPVKPRSWRDIPRAGEARGMSRPAYRDDQSVVAFRNVSLPETCGSRRDHDPVKSNSPGQVAIIGGSQALKLIMMEP